MIIRTEIEDGYVRLRSDEGRKLVSKIDGRAYSEVIVKLDQESNYTEERR